MNHLQRKHRWASIGQFSVAGLAAVLLSHVPVALAELPVEQLTVRTWPAADPYRIYLADPVLPHLVDGRMHVVDGSRMQYLGMIGTGFAGTSGLSRDRKTLFVASTYYSRLQRGTRADVVEVYASDNLTFQYEIELPPKHVQGLPIKALMATTADDRFLLVQNATPATSVSVVDVQGKRLASEIPTPGCYGVIPWPSQPRRFSSVCGDGTLATFALDDKGAPAANSVSEPFFDPDKDPVFMHYEFVGDRLTLVSYHGQVFRIDLGGAQPVVAKPWSMLDAASRKQGWRPGGLQLFGIEPRGNRLYVGMHDKGTEGSHKNPAQQIWVFDLQTQRRVAVMPGQSAVSMTIARTDTPRLFLLSGTDNRILSFDLAAAKAPGKPLARSEPFGETPVYLEMH